MQQRSSKNRKTGPSNRFPAHRSSITLAFTFAFAFALAFAFSFAISFLFLLPSFPLAVRSLHFDYKVFQLVPIELDSLVHVCFGGKRHEHDAFCLTFLILWNLTPRISPHSEKKLRTSSSVISFEVFT